MIQRLKSVPLRTRLIGAAVAVVVLAAVGYALATRQPAAPPTVVTPTPAAFTPPRPPSGGQATAAADRPGLLRLDDFQVTVPEGWERRREWEDDGPGTKLFLLGPAVNDVQLAVGIDVYPLRKGMTLDKFALQYAARWSDRLTLDKSATLSGQPARMISFVEDRLEKVFLLTTYRDKGFVIGMVGPTGQRQKTLPLFREVMDSFQVYE